MIEFPRRGVVRLPHVSAPQWAIPEMKSAMYMLRTQAHKDTQKFLRKYKLLVLKNDTASRITNTETLVISTVLFVLVYLEASMAAFFFLSNCCCCWEEEEEALH